VRSGADLELYAANIKPLFHCCLPKQEPQYQNRLLSTPHESSQRLLRLRLAVAMAATPLEPLTQGSPMAGAILNVMMGV
jgi:hypothetical protein